MGLRDDAEASELPPGDPPLGQTTDPISSPNEAWFHTLDSCVSDSPVSEVILPLMRNFFFGGAMHAVLLLQKGHADQLVLRIRHMIHLHLAQPCSALWLRSSQVNHLIGFAGQRTDQDVRPY